MEPQSTRLIAFSPTGTTRTLVREVGLGLGTANCELDLTRPSVPETTLAASEWVVLGVPVWAGRVPLVARERLSRVRGAGNPAVLVACYGNRAFDDALVELCDLAGEQGLVPMAAAAFVAEHSFSSLRTPIAVGRPDAPDLARAREFGLLSGRKLRDPAAALVPPAVPGNRPYKPRPEHPPRPPAHDVARCTRCGACVPLCPTGALSLGDALHTDPAACISCCACLKGCPQGARSLEDPRLCAVAVRLSTTCTARREPELFL